MSTPNNMSMSVGDAKANGRSNRINNQTLDPASQYE